MRSTHRLPGLPIWFAVALTAAMPFAAAAQASDEIVAQDDQSTQPDSTQEDDLDPAEELRRQAELAAAKARVERDRLIGAEES